jgi:Domain of unknown function (DUF4404)
MNNSPIQQQISALRSALGEFTTVDKSTRDALLDLQREIVRVAGHHSDVHVAERLEEIAVRFEADHPAVGTAIRQAIDSLSKAGI